MIVDNSLEQMDTSCGAAVRVKPKARLCEPWVKRNPKGCKESSRWSESAETTGSDDETNRTPEGCHYAMNIPRLKIRIRREWRPVVLHPSRGAVMTDDFSGGLRGLRPPATFFATLRVAPRSVSQGDCIGVEQQVDFAPNTLPQLRKNWTRESDGMSVARSPKRLGTV